MAQMNAGISLTRNSSELTSSEARILDAHLSGIRDEQRRQSDAVVEISRSLALLTRIEIEHTHTKEALRSSNTRMEGLETRMQHVDNVLPGLLELRKWVLAGMMAGIGMIGLAVVKLVLVDGKPAVYVTAPQGAKP